MCFIWIYIRVQSQFGTCKSHQKSIWHAGANSSAAPTPPTGTRDISTLAIFVMEWFRHEIVDDVSGRLAKMGMRGSWFQQVSTSALRQRPGVLYTPTTLSAEYKRASARGQSRGATVEPHPLCLTLSSPSPTPNTHLQVWGIK